MFFSAFGVWNPEKAQSRNISTKSTSAIQRLDQDTLHSIFSFVSIEDLGRLACVNSYFHKELQESRIWTFACENLWVDKLHVQDEWKNMVKEKLAKDALVQSFTWGKSQHISRVELVSRSWRTAYKPDMIDQLRLADPFHQGLPARRREFKLDGRMHTPPNSSMEWTDISHWTWRLRLIALTDGNVIQIVNYRASWQDFPDLFVYHLPNWGWVLASEYVLMASFDFNQEQFQELCDLTPRFHGVEYYEE